MLLTETLTITVAARSPRVLATNWGPTMQARRGLSYDVEQLDQKVIDSNPCDGKVCLPSCLHYVA